MLLTQLSALLTTPLEEPQQKIDGKEAEALEKCFWDAEEGDIWQNEQQQKSEQ